MCEACCKSLLPALVVVCGCVNKRQCNTSTGLAVAAAVAVLRLRTKQILFAHTLSKSFAIATGYGHAPTWHMGKEKLHVCDFHLVRVYLMPPAPCHQLSPATVCTVRLAACL